ncbi:MAG TPA: ribbon-helix-helix protein, CopG family [Dehalococcoidia bacterium]|nr:ribbon-helix-helix protein, CopG family [Dehalococcoidia bacterium]
MAKKVIQVPFDEELLAKLTRVSKSRRQSRSQLIREACLRYLVASEEEELDRVYEEGYRRQPETTDVAEAQAAVAAQVLPAERW